MLTGIRPEFFALVPIFHLDRSRQPNMKAPESHTVLAGQPQLVLPALGYAMVLGRGSRGTDPVGLTHPARAGSSPPA